MWVHIVDMFHMTGDLSGRRGASSTYIENEEATDVLSGRGVVCKGLRWIIGSEEIFTREPSGAQIGVALRKMKVPISVS